MMARRRDGDGDGDVGGRVGVGDDAGWVDEVNADDGDVCGELVGGVV